MLPEIVLYADADGCLVGDQPELQVTNGGVVKDSAPRSLSVPAKRQITRLRENPIVIATAARCARTLVLGRSNSRRASEEISRLRFGKMWTRLIAFQSLTSRLLAVVTCLYPRDASLAQ
jgi:hypothetical protein